MAALNVRDQKRPVGWRYYGVSKSAFWLGHFGHVLWYDTGWLLLVLPWFTANPIEKMKKTCVDNVLHQNTQWALSPVNAWHIDFWYVRSSSCYCIIVSHKVQWGNPMWSTHPAWDKARPQHRELRALLFSTSVCFLFGRVVQDSLTIVRIEEYING